MSYVYPEKMAGDQGSDAERRNHLMRKRAELLAHIQKYQQSVQPGMNPSPDCWGPSKRGDIVGAFEHPAVQKSMEVNLKVIET